MKKAKNAAKDQTYVLYFLSEEQLAHIKFPLGDFESKADVRAYAKERGFVSAEKPDSEDICFVPDGDYAAFGYVIYGLHTVDATTEATVEYANSESGTISNKSKQAKISRATIITEAEAAEYIALR